MVVHFVEQETGAMMKSVPQTLLLLLLLEGLTSWMSSSSIEVASACGGRWRFGISRMLGRPSVASGQEQAGSCHRLVFLVHFVFFLLFLFLCSGKYLRNHRSITRLIYVLAHCPRDNVLPQYNYFPIVVINRRHGFKVKSRNRDDSHPLSPIRLSLKVEGHV